MTMGLTQSMVENPKEKEEEIAFENESVEESLFQEEKQAARERSRFEEDANDETESEFDYQPK